jgi:hypothetical protein
MDQTTYAQKLEEYKDQIILFTLGIGNSPKTAENAMFEAKEHKVGNYANIGIAKEKGTDVPKLDERAEFIQEIARIAKEVNPIQGSRLEYCVRGLTTDKSTGLRNGLGISQAVQEQKQHNPEQEYAYIIIDGNNMHDLNKILGYEKVDEQLAASGRGIDQAESFVLDRLRIYSNRSREQPVEENRRNHDRRTHPEEDLVMKVSTEKVISGRKHDTGDEFVVMIPMHYAETEVYAIASSILRRIYEAQIIALDKAKSEKGHS